MKDREREISRIVVTELIRRGVLDAKEDVDIRVFSPNLGATEVSISFPQKEEEK